MSPLTDAEAVKLFPSLQYLVLIREAGWIFLPVDDPGDPDAVLDGARVWSAGWRDCLRVRDETDALGLRIRLSTGQPSEIVWERSGTLADVVFRLLELPEPDTRHAPTLVVGKAPKLWTP
ncbi:hypothetical protein [Lentzea sp. NBRC 102530]|uniref:hypothetical protein n=1 Tax=Lentzea sp. NBRC 102530 TaxID=3032201 RepID=UPI0024A042C1|nr:hypothetical protein [Lentzea sp. NBRC 102530]GLY52168.1 hypothetical protein Lesp01_58240 [Lentzea sp. NBRC 102530]